MDAFLAAALAWPTVVFTVLVGLSVLYWVFVIVGAIDVDALDFDGAADGLLEGATEGAAEGAAEGAVEGAAEGGGALLGLFSALRLRNAPVTVVLSLVFLFAWGLSMLGMHYLAELGIGGSLVGAGVGVLAFGLALPATSVAVRPLGPVFRPQIGRRRHELVGQTCTIATGRVDEKFGQATCAVDKDDLLIQVRCAAEKGLRKGHEALIIDYDEAAEAFVVEPLEGGGR